jgi:DNA-binding transcriptional ArsR family regulator
MSPELDLAWIASAVAEPARARMLLVLMDKRARTAKELAFLARVSPATASAHLAKLLDCKLVTVDPQGRHRYYRLASHLVGNMVEAIASVSGETTPRGRAGPRVDGTLATARTCYDHLAGRLAVAIADVLQARGEVLFGDGAGEVTDKGRDFFAGLGIDLHGVGSSRRVFCRPCMDWTERRYHIAGAAGTALCDHCLGQGWVERVRDSRALVITRAGETAFADVFGIDCAFLAEGEARAAA